MNVKAVNQILSDTAYPRVSGTQSEKRGADYLVSACRQLGLSARIESFPRTMYTAASAKLTVDGLEIPCTGYYGAACGTAAGKLYYLRGTDPVSLKNCKDKIVLTDKGLGYKLYDQLTENGAKGCITYGGNVNYPHKDLDQKEIRFTTEVERPLPAAHIHTADAMELVRKGSKLAQLTLAQTPYTGESWNVTLDLPGETEEQIVISAHYDTTTFSDGAYDNMSGCIALLYLAEYFAARPRRLSIRLLWCGSEESGLLGSLAYCRAHKDPAVLNINLDMLGSVMGEFTAFSCADEAMKDLLEKFLKKHRIPGSVRYGIRSSDSNSFVHYGIPAVSFARYAPGHTAAIHTRYDTAQAVSPRQILEDAKIVAKFTEFIANRPEATVPIAISEKIRDDVDAYMQRKLLQ